MAQFGGSGDAAALAVDIAAVGPNPSRGGATVRLTHEAPGPISVDVVDALGRTVAVLYRGMSEAGEHRWALPAGLAAGAYVVRVSGAITARQAVTVVR